MKKQPEQVKPNQNSTVDYLAKLETELIKRGAKTATEKVELFNKITGLHIKSLRIAQTTAKNYLFELQSSPMANK
jgi:hypothetical protein